MRPTKRASKSVTLKQGSGDPIAAAEAKYAHQYELARLHEGLKPFRLYWFPRLRSTNDHAALLCKRDRLAAPAVVLTGHQIAGRGRGVHRWWSRPGCITVTFVLPLQKHIQAHQLPLLAGVALWRAATEITGSNGLQLKWPNDLLFEGHKIAGLLCERIHHSNLVGLGLNVNRENFMRGSPPAPHIGWLELISGRPHNLSEVMITVARHLRAALHEHMSRPFSELLREYDAHHALIGQKVTINPGAPDPASLESPINGMCLGLDEMGRLLVRNREGLHSIIAGQVSNPR